MFQRAHALFDAAPDAGGGIDMCHDISMGAPCFIDYGGNFVIGILQLVDRIGLRRDAATRHQLNLIGALANFVTYRFTHFGDAIGDPAKPEVREMRRAFAGLELIGGGARIAVPNGLTGSRGRRRTDVVLGKYRALPPGGVPHLRPPHCARW